MPWELWHVLFPSQFWSTGQHPGKFCDTWQAQPTLALSSHAQQKQWRDTISCLETHPTAKSVSFRLGHTHTTSIELQQISTLRLSRSLVIQSVLQYSKLTFLLSSCEDVNTMYVPAMVDFGSTVLFATASFWALTCRECNSSW